MLSKNKMKVVTVMNLRKVNSSNISDVGFDPSNSTLIVRFKNGSYYQFDNVPERAYMNMIEATSVGKYFNSYIKNNFQFKKLEVKEEDEALWGVYK